MNKETEKMRTPTTPTQADTPGPRNPIRVDRGDRRRTQPCPDLSIGTADAASLSAFRTAKKGGRLADTAICLHGSHRARQDHLSPAVRLRRWGA